MSELNHKVISATKWSSVTEIAAKLVAPISTMVLARVLTPEAFGVLVTATMVISFAEIFTDAGFQKYIVQHEFDNDKALYKSTNIAFWANLAMSVAVWVCIILFDDQIAELVGNKGYGSVISVSCICIPIAAFSSIQMAVYRRRFDYKTLFIVRMIGVAIPLVITIPLAFWLRSYWALIAGMIGLNLSNAVLLTIKSQWRPKFEFDFSLLKKMFSFTIWSMCEAVAIWLTAYVDIFIVGRVLNEYYLGIYRTSMNTVGQLTGLITAATGTVLFTSLSRLQNDSEEFKKMFFRFQKAVGLLVIPMGVCIFLFSNEIVEILLGPQWLEAAHFTGLWGLTSSLAIVLGHYCSEVYRSLGKPKISVIAQILQIIVLIPAVLYAIGYGFEVLCDVRALVRLAAVAFNLALMQIVVKMSPWSMIRNVLPEMFAASMMLIVLVLPSTDSFVVKCVYILIAAAIYITIIMLFPKERHIALKLKSVIKNK